MKSVNTTHEDEEEEPRDPFNLQKAFHGQSNANQFDSVEEFKCLPDFTLKDKYNFLKSKFSSLLDEKAQTES